MCHARRVLPALFVCAAVASLAASAPSKGLADPGFVPADKTSDARPAPVERHLGPLRPLGTSAHDALVRQQLLDPNELGLYVWNNGTWGWNLETLEGGLCYPKGSNQSLVFAAGLWVAGRAPDLRVAVAEFAQDFVPGAIGGGAWAPDTLRYGVYGVARHDTSGTAAWMARAVPIGAPTDSTGMAPGLIGERTLWTVFNDWSSIARHDPVRTSAPIGLEVQLTAFAFGRPGLERAAFLHYTIIHKGVGALDSAYVGLWVDWLAGPRTILAASDTARDMAYAYRFTDADPNYGARGPAAGVRLLRGPRDPSSGARLRATSHVVWPNGADPWTPGQVFRLMQGFHADGSAMIDSSTFQPTRFWSTGDPVSGAGWNAQTYAHPHGVLSAGPFRFAPGDTQQVDALIVVGQANQRLISIQQMRTSSDSLAQLFADGFSWAPSPPPPPPPVTLPPWPSVRAWPSPGAGPITIAFTAPPGGATADVTVHDLAGRRVRTLARGVTVVNRGEAIWDGRDDDDRTVRPGVYIVRARVGQGRAAARCVRVE